MTEIIESVRKRIEEVDYICRNVYFEYEENGYLYFDAVDLANCQLSVRVKIDSETSLESWEMHESYGDDWEIIKNSWAVLYDGLLFK